MNFSQFFNSISNVFMSLKHSIQCKVAPDLCTQEVPNTCHSPTDKTMTQIDGRRIHRVLF